MIFNIPIPSLFICFLIFIVWMHYENRKSNKKQAQASQEFWQREEEANHARNRDISDLPMFVPAQNDIPFPETTDENVLYYQKRVRDSLELPMMNLSKYSNTDLKLAYGVGNFKTLSEYDANFNNFLMNLSNLGSAYHTIGLYEEAADIFRYCLTSGSEKARDYKALADAYVSMGCSGRISELITEVERSELPRKSTLVENLRAIQKSS